MNIVKELALLSNQEKFNKEKLLTLLENAKKNEIEFSYDSFFIPKLFLTSDMDKKDFVDVILNSDYFDFSYNSNEILGYIISEENNPLRVHIFNQLIKKENINLFEKPYFIKSALSKYIENKSEQNKHIFNTLYLHKNMKSEYLIDYHIIDSCSQSRQFDILSDIIDLRNDLDFSIHYNKILNSLIGGFGCPKHIVKKLLLKKNVINNLKMDFTIYNKLLLEDDFYDIIRNYEKINNF